MTFIICIIWYSTVCMFLNHYRRIVGRAYAGAGSKTIQTFPSDEESDDDDGQVNFTSAWRPGQPPRGDCVIKLTKSNIVKVCPIH